MTTLGRCHELRTLARLKGGCGIASPAADFVSFEHQDRAGKDPAGPSCGDASMMDGAARCDALHSKLAGLLPSFRPPRACLSNQAQLSQPWQAPQAPSPFPCLPSTSFPPSRWRQLQLYSLYKSPDLAPRAREQLHSSQTRALISQHPCAVFISLGAYSA